MSAQSAIQNPQSTNGRLPFAPPPVTCDLCFGIGLRHRPTGGIEQCPALQFGLEHCDLSEEGKLIVRAVANLRARRLDVDPIHFDVARSLAQFSTTRPCSSRDLGERHFSYKAGEDRRRLVTKAIRFLRDIWFLPVVARKDKPAGYWIAVTQNDFAAWVDEAKDEPITRLSTIMRLAKANYPVFAEQIEIDFWKDFGAEDLATEHTEKI